MPIPFRPEQLLVVYGTDQISYTDIIYSVFHRCIRDPSLELDPDLIRFKVCSDRVYVWLLPIEGRDISLLPKREDAFVVCIHHHGLKMDPPLLPIAKGHSWMPDVVVNSLTAWARFWYDSPTHRIPTKERMRTMVNKHREKRYRKRVAREHQVEEPDGKRQQKGNIEETEEPIEEIAYPWNAEPYQPIEWDYEKECADHHLFAAYLTDKYGDADYPGDPTENLRVALAKYLRDEAKPKVSSGGNPA